MALDAVTLVEAAGALAEAFAAGARLVAEIIRRAGGTGEVRPG